MRHKVEEKEIDDAHALYRRLGGSQSRTRRLLRRLAFRQRGKVLNTTWNRYNVINVASFATAAAAWFPGRLGLSGKEIDRQTRNLVLAKDVLFGVGALTGLASVIQGRALAGQAPEGAVPIESGTTPAATTPEKAASLLRSVNQLGNLDILVTGAILSITTILSMKSTESARFSVLSRLLP